ncbi:MAG: hypothetical protein ACXV9S_14260 [Acidimicrobiia bacterium]
MSDAERVDVDGADGPVASLFLDRTDGVRVVVAPARTLLTVSEAQRVLAAVPTGGAATVTLETMDPALRHVARAAGFGGALRAPLVRDAGVPPSAVSSSGTDPAAAVAAFLPDAEISVTGARSPQRVLRFLATGLDRSVRIEARRDGTAAAVVTPLGPSALPEPIAATLDTLLALHRRLGAVADRVPPVRFAVSDARIADGHVAGANAGGGIVLSPMYVDATELERIRGRRDARDPAARGPRRPLGRQFAIDLVVVHEAGHSIDQAVRSGRLSDTAEFRRAVGEAVGIPSIELAFRADWLDAEASWRDARDRVVDEISAYATTNCVELFAEVFVAWWTGADSPVVRAFDGVLRSRYPELV